MKRIFIIILVFMILCPALSLDNPEKKIESLIQNYVIQKHPEWSGLEIKITFKSADIFFQSLTNLSEKTQFKISDAYQNSSPAGNAIVPIEYQVGDKLEKIFIRAKIEVFKNVVAAAKTIKRGSIIDGEDLKLEKRDVSSLPQNFFERYEQILFTEAKTTIPQNSLVYEWMIKEIPLFRRTDEVTIHLVADNLKIKTTALALEDGYPGQAIRVKRKGSDKILEGVVLANKVVEVRLK